MRCRSTATVIVTSPIWVTTGSGIAVCDFACVDTVARSGVTARVRAEIVNRNEQAMCGVTAVLYEAARLAGARYHRNALTSQGGQARTYGSTGILPRPARLGWSWSCLCRNARRP